MTNKLTFNSKYFTLAVLIFIVEVLIALFVNDGFIRPYLGDVLVILLLYCFVKSFVKLTQFQAALSVLLFAFAVELLQYFQFVELLGWQNNPIARTIIGTSFDWHDIAMYCIGFTMIFVFEFLFRKR